MSVIISSKPCPQVKLTLMIIAIGDACLLAFKDSLILIRFLFNSY